MFYWNVRRFTPPPPNAPLGPLFPLGVRGGGCYCHPCRWSIRVRVPKGSGFTPTPQAHPTLDVRGVVHCDSLA